MAGGISERHSRGLPETTNLRPDLLTVSPRLSSSSSSMPSLTEGRHCKETVVQQAAKLHQKKSISKSRFLTFLGQAGAIGPLLPAPMGSTACSWLELRCPSLKTSLPAAQRTSSQAGGHGWQPAGPRHKATRKPRAAFWRKNEL